MIDSDGDGRISATEALGDGSQEAQEYAWLHTVADANGDGLVDVEELGAFYDQYDVGVDDSQDEVEYDDEE